MRPINLGVISVVMLLCFSWAYQQIAIKLALPEVGPMTQGAIRNGGACLLALAFFFAKNITWHKGVNLPGVIVGFLFGLEFLLIYQSLSMTDAARATLFVYTSPFVVAVGEHLRPGGDRLDGKSWLGIGLAFVGVGLALGPGAPETKRAVFGDGLALVSGFVWGATTLMIKGSNLKLAPATQVLLYQLGIGALMFIVGMWYFEEALVWPEKTVTFAAIGFQVFWVASISYGIWFFLIKTYSATSLSVLTFVTPIFGVILGIGLLGESLIPAHIVGTVLVASGIVLVSLPRATHAS